MEHEFRLIGYVFMPEHVHLVIVPTVDSVLSAIIGDIKRFSAHEIHGMLLRDKMELIKALTVFRDRHTDFALWKRRFFDHNCRNDESVKQKVDYCHYNPVKRGMVSAPEDWIWSSYRWYQGRQDVPLRIDFKID